MKNHPFNEITVQLQISREAVVKTSLSGFSGIQKMTFGQTKILKPMRDPLTLEEARNLMLMATDEERTGLHVITQHVAERL